MGTLLTIITTNIYRHIVIFSTLIISVTMHVRARQRGDSLSKSSVGDAIFLIYFSCNNFLSTYERKIHRRTINPRSRKPLRFSIMLKSKSTDGSQLNQSTSYCNNNNNSRHRHNSSKRDKRFSAVTSVPTQPRSLLLLLL